MMVGKSSLVPIISLWWIANVVNAFSPTSLLANTHARSLQEQQASTARGTVPLYFQQNVRSRSKSNPLKLASATVDDSDLDPQVISTGFSQAPDLVDAIKEATKAALSNLPPVTADSDQKVTIDLGLVYISSLYDAQSSPTNVVPTILEVCDEHYGGMDDGEEVLQKLIGCYTGGLVSSDPVLDANAGRACSPFEKEGVQGVTVTLCLLPETNLQTFHVLAEDVPDDVGRVSPETWKNSVGLRGFNQKSSDNEDEDDSSVIMVIPSPAFQNELDDFLLGLTMAFGSSSSTIFGGLASTVSSLSRARLFRFDVNDPYAMQTLGDGCVGLAMSGDIQAKVMMAQGAKPVGGVYRVVAGEESTIGAIQLDEVATEQLKGEEDDDIVEEEEEELSEEDQKDARKRAAALYAKAVIPKPVLAEANFLMRTLSDDDQAFMRKSLLIGLERSGGIAKTSNELLRLAEGQGHRFTIHSVASAGMKDGSVTLPLGSVNIERGARLRFFVRDGTFAKKEVQALWTGYKKRELTQSLFGGDSENSDNLFVPSGCLFFPTLDRGTKLFGGKPGFESGAVTECLPALPSVGGCFTNGVIAKLEETDSQVMVHGSASCSVLIGPKKKRPIYSPVEAAAKRKELEKKAAEEAEAEQAVAVEDEKRTERAKGLTGNDNDEPAPRSEDGELIIRRREVHSGRALTVSNVEWSVVERTAAPTSSLEGFMWDKETEVDRFRERVPLSNLVSQCKLSNLDPKSPKPRDWVGALKFEAQTNPFVIIPEMKRLDPSTGSLRKRYDLSKLTKQFTLEGAPALGVNCDQVLYGGTIEDITTAREVSSKSILEAPSSEDGVVAPPILASDLILYPYQLYKLRLAGADAVNLIVGALEGKDLLYLTKIAATLQMQMVASVTSEVQIRSVSKLAPGSVSALVVSNRDLENFTFDDSGEQALNLLKSDALQEFRNANPNVPILVEGQVGIIEQEGSTGKYLQSLKEAGATGAIVGGGLAKDGDGIDSYKALCEESQ